jgi:hypothetical protein
MAKPTDKSQQDIPAIESVFKSPELDIIELVDPAQVQLYRTSVADQMNESRMGASPPKRCVDLADNIADIIIETAVQGASLLEVHVIDPAWVLLARDSNGVSFIDVDPDNSGYLWPPIEVNFPPDSSDAVWRLCQVRASTDLTGANLILTFEDRITAELRELQGPVVASSGSTRAQFIQFLVDDVKVGGKKSGAGKVAPALGVGQALNLLGSAGAARAGIPPDPNVRFVPIFQAGVETPFTAGSPSESVQSQNNPPASATQPNAPPARQNPSKKPGPSPGQKGKPASIAVVKNGRAAAQFGDVPEIAIASGYYNTQVPPITGTSLGL